MQLLQLEVAVFVWNGAERHAERICRHAWPDVMVLSGDEKSFATTVLSVRSSHPYVQWVVIFAVRSMSGKGSLEPCEEDCWHEDDPLLLFELVWLSSATSGPQFVLHLCWKAPLASLYMRMNVSLLIRMRTLSVC